MWCLNVSLLSKTSQHCHAQSHSKNLGPFINNQLSQRMRHRGMQFHIFEQSITFLLLCLTEWVFCMRKDTCIKKFQNNHRGSHLRFVHGTCGQATSSYEKHWLRYRNMFVVKVITKHTSLTDVIGVQRALVQLLKAGNMVTILRLPNILVPRVFHTEMKYLISPKRFRIVSYRVTAVMSSFEDNDIAVRSSVPVVIPARFMFIFKLQKKLQLAVYIKNLRLFGVATWCEFNLTIVSMGQKERHFLLCGLYSDLDLYPPSEHVHFMWTVAAVSDLCFSFFFNLIATKVINTVTLSIAPMNEFYKIVQTVILWPVKKYSHLNFMKSEKWKQLQVKITNLSSAVLYDGPGLLSRKLTIFANRNGFKCSSFQCLLHLQSDDAEQIAQVFSRSVFNSDHLQKNFQKLDKYQGNKQPFFNVHIQKSNKSITKIYQFLSSRKMDLNISVIELKY